SLKDNYCIVSSKCPIRLQQIAALAFQVPQFLSISAIVSLVGFFLHFAKLTNIVLISPSFHCWVFFMPLPGSMRVPVNPRKSDKLSIVFRICEEDSIPSAFPRAASSLTLGSHRHFRWKCARFH